MSGSYPAGCTGPPDDDAKDPHPASIKIFDLLEASNVDQEVIDEITRLVDDLARQADAECQTCLARFIEAELVVGVEYPDNGSQ